MTVIPAALLPPIAAARPVSGWVVGTAVAGTLVIAGGAFWLSFTTLTNLAELAGINATQSWVWPLIVDGLIVVATVAAVALNPYGWKVAWYPWALLFGGTLISVAANATHAILTAPTGFPMPIAAVISSVPPLMLLATTHLTVVLTSHTGTSAAFPTSLTDPTTAETDAEEVLAGDTARLQLEAAQLHQLRWSNRRIARALDVHPSTIGRWLNRTSPDDQSALGRSAGIEPDDGKTPIT